MKIYSSPNPQFSQSNIDVKLIEIHATYNTVRKTIYSNADFRKLEGVNG
jgi:hypothetical protein